MKIRQVAQKAIDLNRAISFYSKLLGAEPTAVFNPPGLAFFKLGETRLLLDTNAPTALIYLQVEDVENVTADLEKAGIQVVTKPHVVFPDDQGIFDTPGEEWLSIIKDSEGNLVGLMSRKANS